MSFPSSSQGSYNSPALFPPEHLPYSDRSPAGSRGGSASTLPSARVPQPLRNGITIPLLTMTGMFLAAVAASVGHHAFNTHLKGHKVAPIANNWKDVSVYSQRGASAIGTALAFVVKTCLSAAIGTSFIQCAWRIVQRRTNSIGSISALLSAKSDLLAFLSLDFLSSARMSFILVAAIWMLPLIAVFTPGTLGITDNLNSTTSSCTVPWMDLRQAQNLLYGGSAGFDFYLAAAASRTVGYTLYIGQPYTPISPCGANCSYTINVNAPALRCNESVPADTTFLQSGLSVYWNALPIGPVWDSNQNTSGNFAVEWGNATLWNQDTLPSFACNIYNATYTIAFAFGSTTAEMRITDIEYNNGYPFSTTAPTSINQMDPDQIEASNYEAIKNALYNHLTGAFYREQESFDRIDPLTLDVMLTSLVVAYNSSGLTWVSDLPSGVEQLMQNVTLSLVAQNLNTSTTTETQCTYSTSTTVFEYHSTTLYAAYGSGLGMCFVAVVLGLVALRGNGFGGGTSFSAVLDATRNPGLADVSHHLDDKTPLRYGRLPAGIDAFGTEDDLRQMAGRPGAESFPLLPTK